MCEKKLGKKLLNLIDTSLLVIQDRANQKNSEDLELDVESRNRTVNSAFLFNLSSILIQCKISSASYDHFSLQQQFIMCIISTKRHNIPKLCLIRWRDEIIKLMFRNMIYF